MSGPSTEDMELIQSLTGRHQHQCLHEGINVFRVDASRSHSSHDQARMIQELFALHRSPSNVQITGNQFSQYQAFQLFRTVPVTGFRQPNSR